MSERRDFDLQLERWLESEATGRAPDRMFERVFATTARTGQARALPGWLTPPGAVGWRRPVLLAAALIALALAASGLVAGASWLLEHRGPAPSAVRSATAATVATACPHADAAVRVGSTVWIRCPDQARRLDAATGSLTGVVKAQAFAVDDRDVWVASGQAVNVLEPGALTIVSSFALPGVTAIGLDPTTAWLATNGDRQIVRVDRASLTTTATIPLPDDAGAVVVGGGSVWVTLPRSDRVIRIDPTTNAISASVAVASPAGIAYGGGRVWILDARASVLTTIDPASNAAHGRAFLPLAAAPGATSALPPGSSGPPGGFALAGTSLWEVAGSDIIEIDAASGDVLQQLQVIDPPDVSVTTVTVVDGGLLLVDGQAERVLSVNP